MSEQRVIMSAGSLGRDLLGEIGGKEMSQVYVLTDEVTNKLCLPLLRAELPEIDGAHIIKIGHGDESKTLESLESVWEYLSHNGATRKSIMLNLGGGMVTDLGGFAASTFKRGMTYINIPTTLLGAVDAAVGGKTGINFAGLKNEIGVINASKSVLIDTRFFATLDSDNFVSGFAEMIKHGLISDQEHWGAVLGYDLRKKDLGALSGLLRQSIAVKEAIVEKDPTEKNIRKALNFGHTVGHAFESYALERDEPILHGFAVAYGMIAELFLSYKLCGFGRAIMQEAVELIRDHYGRLAIDCKVYDHLYELMTHDKKNNGDGKIMFTLLGDKGIGDIRINQDVSRKDILDSLDYYRDIVGL